MLIPTMSTPSWVKKDSGRKCAVCLVILWPLKRKKVKKDIFFAINCVIQDFFEGLVLLEDLCSRETPLHVMTKTDIMTFEQVSEPSW